MCFAEMAPAAMPEAARRTGNFSTSRGVIDPPPEWRRSRSPWYPPSWSCSASRFTYPDTSGASTAFATAVLKRGYSKISGRIAAEVETVASGITSSRISRIRVSWAGSA